MRDEIGRRGTILNQPWDDQAALASLRTDPLPRLIIDADLHVLWANQSAEALLCQGRELLIEEERLVVRDQPRTLGFGDFLRCLGHDARVWAFKRAGAKGYFLVDVRRVSHARRDLFALSMTATADDTRFLWADISRILGLTRSETEIVKRLIEGGRVQDVAASLGVRVETARSHLRNVYAKLGISSREELFAAVLPYRLG